MADIKRKRSWRKSISEPENLNDSSSPIIAFSKLPRSKSYHGDGSTKTERRKLKQLELEEEAEENIGALRKALLELLQRELFDCNPLYEQYLISNERPTIIHNANADFMHPKSYTSSVPEELWTVAYVTDLISDNPKHLSQLYVVDWKKARQRTEIEVDSMLKHLRIKVEEHGLHQCSVGISIKADVIRTGKLYKKICMQMELRIGPAIDTMCPSCMEHLNVQQVYVDEYDRDKPMEFLMAIHRLQCPHCAAAVEPILPLCPSPFNANKKPIMSYNRTMIDDRCKSCCK
jgi:hypothetical protein